MVENNDKRKEEFNKRIKVAYNESPFIAEELLLGAELREKQNVKNNFETVKKEPEINPYYGGPFELEDFLFKLEQKGFFSGNEIRDDDEFQL